jgi:hypothetical protein
VRHVWDQFKDVLLVVGFELVAGLVVGWLLYRIGSRAEKAGETSMIHQDSTSDVYITRKCSDGTHFVRRPVYVGRVESVAIMFVTGLFLASVLWLEWPLLKRFAKQDLRRAGELVNRLTEKAGFRFALPRQNGNA